jgi:hypothetical protein
MASHPQVIVVGAGLSGLAAAHTLFEKGANVLVLEKVSREAFNGQLRSIRRVHGRNHSPLPLHAAQNPFGGGAWIARRAMRVFSLLFVRRRKPDSRFPLGLPLPPPQATRPVRAQINRSLCSCSPSIDSPTLCSQRPLRASTVLAQRFASKTSSSFPLGCKAESTGS